MTAGDRCALIGGSLASVTTFAAAAMVVAGAAMPALSFAAICGGAGAGLAAALLLGPYELSARARHKEGLAVAIAGNALAVLVWCPLALVAPGSSIRPMGIAALCGLIAGVTLLAGIGLSLVNLRATRKAWPIASLILCFAPMVLTRWWVGFMMWRIGFALSD